MNQLHTQPAGKAQAAGLSASSWPLLWPSSWSLSSSRTVRAPSVLSSVGSAWLSVLSSSGVAWSSSSFLRGGGRSASYNSSKKATRDWAEPRFTCKHWNVLIGLRLFPAFWPAKAIQLQSLFAQTVIIYPLKKKIADHV
jgi:hypothetical protein